ncbi:MAG: LamG-like jellyroll fold domain-containing protein [Candidatus Cloacimonadales bacterium]
MGRTLLLTVIMITVIFGGIAIMLFQRTNELPQMASRNLYEISLRNTGAYALNYGIRLLQNDSTLRDNLPTLPNYYDLSFTNFELEDARIDSLKFALFDSDQDSLQVLAVVSKLIDGTRKYRRSEARLGVSIGAHPDQVGGWSLDENYGNQAYDSVGNYTGNLKNFSDPDNAWVEGKWNNALSFDGVDDYISLPKEVVESWAGKFTVASWFKLDPTAEGWGIVISEQKLNAPNTMVWAVASNLEYLSLPDGTSYAQVTFTFFINTIGNPNINSVSITKTEYQMDPFDWHFIMASYDDTTLGNRATIKIQIVDENFSSVTDSDLIKKIQFHADENAPNIMTIGGLPTDDPWGSSVFPGDFNAIEGSIDEVYFFNEIISDEDFFSLYLNNGFGEDQIIYWKQ